MILEMTGVILNKMAKKYSITFWLTPGAQSKV